MTTEQSMLLRRLSTAQFAAWELHIYLDTHPNDQNAIASYQKYCKTAAELSAQYEKQYGPLTASDPFGDTRWDWVNEPWPWDPDKEADR